MRGCVLGVDVGVASLGAALIEVEIVGGQMHYRRIIDGVSHIFPEPQGAPERRKQIAMRKGYQRRSRRLAMLRKLLAERFEIDPGFDDHPSDLGLAYQGECARSGQKPVLSINSRARLRAAGLRESLSRGDLARAILHMAKNRGMRLTRALDQGRDEKAEKQAQTEAAGMAQEAREIERQMAAAHSPAPGDFLWQIEQRAQQGHRRPALHNRKGRTGGFLFTRRQIEDEFDLLMASQQRFHGGWLHDEVTAEIRDIVFWEKEAPEPAIGPCLYFPDEELRIPIASDLYQRKRIYEQVNSIQIKETDESRERLTPEQRDILVARLLDGERLTTAAIRKLLKITRGRTLSLDAGYGSRTESTEIKGHMIIAEFRKVPEFLMIYQGLDAERQKEIVEILRKERDRELVIEKLTQGFGLDAGLVGEILDTVVLRAGYCATGPTATRRLLEAMRDQVLMGGENAGRVMLPYDAEQFLGLERAGARIVPMARLPYYGTVFPHLVRDKMRPSDRGYPAATNEQKFGRIPNPVVHVAMNRLRKVINALLKKHSAQFGQPLRVHVEFARDMSMSDDERKKYESQIKREHRQNTLDDAMIVQNNGIPSRKARRMLKLAREQNWQCPYSLQEISLNRLFDDYDIDHILPRSETLDDGMGNLVLVYRDANRVKGKKSPFEAFGHGRDYLRADGQQVSHEQMINFVRNCKGMAHKAWRFGPEAMARYQDEQAFSERYLSDTRYIAKWAAQYLQIICRPGVFGEIKPVVALNGRIVSDLRYGWGLHHMVEDIAAEQEPDLAENKEAASKKGKDRSDHRHHLLDAIVTALTPYDLVRQLKETAKQKLQRPDGRIGRLVPKHPWQNFAHDIERFLRAANASHRNNRNINVQMHEATGLGIVARFGDGSFLVRTRKRLDGAAFADPDKLHEQIGISPKVMAALAQAVQDPAAQIFWSSTDPVGDMGDIADDLRKLCDDILSIYETIPVVEKLDRLDDDPLIRQLKPEERLSRAVVQYVENTGRRTIRVYGFSQAVVLERNPAGKPMRSYRPGSNAWLDIYRMASGDVAYEVPRTIDAMNPEFRPAWQADENNQLLLRLYQGDSVEITDKTGMRRLCVFRENSPGDWCFQPVNLAGNVRDTVLRSRLRFSFKALLTADPRLFVRDGTGTVIWRSPRRNW